MLSFRPELPPMSYPERTVLFDALRAAFYCLPPAQWAGFDPSEIEAAIFYVFSQSVEDSRHVAERILSMVKSNRRRRYQEAAERRLTRA